MHVERVGGMVSGNTEYISVRIAGIVNYVGQGSLFACGLQLDNHARRHLTHGYLAHVMDASDAMTYHVQSTEYGPERLVEVQRALAATYGVQTLVDGTGHVPVFYPPEF